MPACVAFACAGNAVGCIAVLEPAWYGVHNMTEFLRVGIRTLRPEYGPCMPVRVPEPPWSGSELPLHACAPNARPPRLAHLALTSTTCSITTTVAAGGPSVPKDTDPILTYDSQPLLLILLIPHRLC